MKAFRRLLALAGIAMIGYAVFAAATSPQVNPGRQLRFLVLVLLINDALVLPLAIGVGVLVARLAPATARPAVQAALIVTASLTVVAGPLMLGYGRLADNPSVLPRDYVAGYLGLVAAVWLVAAAAMVMRYLAARQRRSRRGG
jgi:hypothetical protein